jgi:predicted RNase H-like nuclease (RuvC/YqgF family)
MDGVSECMLDPMASEEGGSGSILSGASCGVSCACQQLREENAQLRQSLEESRCLVEQKTLQIQQLERSGDGGPAGDNLMLQELHREVASLKRSLAKKEREEDRMRDRVFTAELQRDAALVKFHTAGEKLIRRIQVWLAACLLGTVE